MTNRPRWLGPLLIVLLAMLAATVWQGSRWLAGGSGLETEISQLVPAGNMDPVEQRLYRNLVTQGSGRLVVVVEGEQVTEVEAASIDLQGGLAGLPGVVSVDARPDPQRLERLAEFLAPYRAGLLAPADRAALDEEPGEAVRRWLASDPFFRPLPVDTDPLGTLGRFIAQSLPASGAVDSDGFYYWAEREAGESYTIATFASLSPEGIGTERNDRLRQELEALFDTLRGAHDVELNASGVLFHASAAKQQAKWESSVFGVVSVTLIIALLAYGFRSIQPVVALVVVIGIALLTGLTTAQWLFNDLHVLTLVMALPVIGIAVDYVIHSQVNRGRDAGAATARGLPPHLLRGLTWGCLSSALGYAALAAVDVPVMRQVSVVLVVGLITALLWVVAMAYLLPTQANRGRIAALSASPLVQRASRGTVVNRFILVGVLAVLITAALGTAGAGAVRIVDTPEALHYVEPELARADRRVQERLDLAGQRRTLLVSGDSVEQVLQRQEALAARLEERLGVQATGLANIVPSLARQRDNRALTARAYAALSAAQRARLRDAGADFPNAQDGPLLRPASLPAFITDRLPPFEVTAPVGGTPWAALSLAEAADWSRVEALCAAQAGCRVVDSVAALTDVLAGTHSVARIGLGAAVLLVVLVLVARYRQRGLWAGAALVLVMLGGAVIPGAFGLPLTLFGTGGLFVLLGLSVDYLVFTAETPHPRDYTWLAFMLSAATTLLTFGFLLLSLTPAVKMLAAPVVAGLPVLLAVLYFVQACLAPPGSTNNENIEEG